MFQHASQKHKHLSWRESYQTELRIYDALSLVLALAAAQALRFGWLQGLLQVDVLPVPYWLVGLLLAVGWWLWLELRGTCLLYTSPSPRDATLSRMPSSA